MIPNRSPWIHQLKRERVVEPLDRDIKTQIVVVGGGIAGITTAYFLLKNTKKEIVLIEADKIAHGATGHNAGQITPYFERPLTSIVEEFGVEMAIKGQEAIESGWILFDEIYKEAKLHTPHYRFTGYDALSSEEQVFLELENNFYRVQGGLEAELILIDEKSEILKNISPKYKGLYKTIQKKDLLELLETNNKDYICAVSYEKGCMNSALFCEELLTHMVSMYKERFAFYEGSPVKMINLKESSVSLDVLGRKIEAEKAVLCTNGFENFNITNESGKEIDTKFHHSISGRIGYMAGYLEPLSEHPIATSYFMKSKNKSGDPTGEPYFLLTRRPHEYNLDTSRNLVCGGGPEIVLPNHASYSRHDEYSENRKHEITELLKENYKKYSHKTEFSFYWHGLMGYTPNGIRRIGEEPLNPNLLYNLGCNGIGILPSIYGADRISKIINGRKMDKTIFDPIDQTDL